MAEPAKNLPEPMPFPPGKIAAYRPKSKRNFVCVILMACGDYRMVREIDTIEGEGACASVKVIGRAVKVLLTDLTVFP